MMEAVAHHQGAPVLNQCYPCVLWDSKINKKANLECPTL